MRCNTTTCPMPYAGCPSQAPRTRSPLARGLIRPGSLVRRAWRAYWDWRARQVTIVLLQSLDPRMLHDIGIAPSEIEGLVRNGGDGRRRYDAAWLWRCGS